MHHRPLVILVATALAMTPSTRLYAESETTGEILNDILASKQAVLTALGPSSPTNTIFLAFWDFDGTILKGDCSEGLLEAGKPVYVGLAERMIEGGHSRVYRPGGGVADFWRDYRHMEEKIGPWLAYPFIPQMLRGADAAEVVALSRAHFETVLRRHYFSASTRLLRGLEENGVENHVLSASADLFVDAAAATLDLPPERFNGITLRIREGILTEELVYPVTWAEGKTIRLLEIVAETRRRNPGKEVVVLAGFGNSHGTDGPFLKHIATQALPGGQAVSIMINGGEEPAAYRGLFRRINLSKVDSEISP